MHSSCALMETSLRHRAVGCLPEHGEVMFSLAKTAEGLTDRLRAPVSKLSNLLKVFRKSLFSSWTFSYGAGI